MKLINDVVTETEAEFSFDELFVSRTDKRGIIVSGNDVFIRISGYSEEELVGRPHNIIRHPDMPASVFKILWDLIQNDKIAVAYVKNRAKDGRIYWVVATVFPFDGGYLSIRFKPASEYFLKIKEVYTEAKEIEDKQGRDASHAFLIEWLGKHGFASYEEFMTEALRVELKLRDEKVGRSDFPEPSRLYEKLLLDLSTSMRAITQRFGAASRIFNLLPTLKGHFGKHSLAFADICEQLQSLSVNMSISSHKLGKEGGTLSIVANIFQNTTLQVLKNYERFSKNSADVSQRLAEIMIGILSSRVQAEMLSFYIYEILGSKAVATGDKGQIAKELEQVTHLFELTQSLFHKCTTQQRSFFKVLSQFHKDTVNLQNLILRLDLIRTGGKLEGSRSTEIAEIFKPFLDDMGRHLLEVGGPVTQLQEVLAEFSREFEKILDEMTRVEFGVEEGLHTLLSAKEIQDAFNGVAVKSVSNSESLRQQ